MISSLQRVSLLALAFYFSSAALAAQGQPYAPILMIRSGKNLVERKEVVASRPFTDDMYARSEEDPIQIKRSITSWADSNFFGSRSEDVVHFRGLIDEELQKRATKCKKDSQCKSSYYCSPSTKKCTAKKLIGSKCHKNNAECYSDYCSVKTDLCRAQALVGGACLSDDGCKGTLYCVNKVCKKPGKKTTTPTTPSKSSPSGSAKNKRELRSVE